MKKVKLLEIATRKNDLQAVRCWAAFFIYTLLIPLPPLFTPPFLCYHDSTWETGKTVLGWLLSLHWLR